MGCAKSQFWTPKLLGAWTASTTGAIAADRVILHMSMPTEVHELYGSPSEVWLDLAFLHSSPSVVVDLQLVNKTTTRLPEALFFTFPVRAFGAQGSAHTVATVTGSVSSAVSSPMAPAASAPAESAPAASTSNTANDAVWELDKLGQWVGSKQVLEGGGVHLHAVGEQGVRLNLTQDGASFVQAMPIDSGLVSIGRKSAFPTPLVPLSSAEAQGSVYFVLQNNYWDVNYVSRDFPSASHATSVSGFVSRVFAHVLFPFFEPFWFPFDEFTKDEANARFRFEFAFSP
jgi:hypothetical protein